ncbi:MAG: 3'-5' exonuclease [Betaproteobacteria bacterium]|nr:3'-5' exonuclease [Betaproteobacteria bacterium]
MAPILVFDIETIPDVAGIRRLWGIDASVDDAAVAELAAQRRRQATGGDFLPQHLHRVVAISCALRDRDSVKVWSLGTNQDGEAALVKRFFDGIDKYTPQLVSWNGSGFDLPVLHYRALMHGIVASRYWDLGEDDREFKFNNYLARYHTRHVDLMDLLASYQNRAFAPLDEIAQLNGLPGKLGMDGSKVWDAWREGKIDAIRDYCETDVANTYLLFLRFQRMRGILAADAFEREMGAFRAFLAEQKAPHWREFDEAWKKASP